MMAIGIVALFVGMFLGAVEERLLGAPKWLERAAWMLPVSGVLLMLASIAVWAWRTMP